MRVITKFEELFEIGNGAVIRDGHNFVMENSLGEWYVPGEELPYAPSWVELPAIVLWEAGNE